MVNYNGVYYEVVRLGMILNDMSIVGPLSQGPG